MSDLIRKFERKSYEEISKLQKSLIPIIEHWERTHGYTSEANIRFAEDSMSLTLQITMLPPSNTPQETIGS